MILSRTEALKENTKEVPVKTARLIEVSTLGLLDLENGIPNLSPQARTLPQRAPNSPRSLRVHGGPCQFGEVIGGLRAEVVLRV